MCSQERACRRLCIGAFDRTQSTEPLEIPARRLSRLANAPAGFRVGSQLEQSRPNRAAGALQGQSEWQLQHGRARYGRTRHARRRQGRCRVRSTARQSLHRRPQPIKWREAQCGASVAPRPRAVQKREKRLCQSGPRRRTSPAQAK
jgi:hypothetical protein